MDEFPGTVCRVVHLPQKYQCQWRKRGPSREPIPAFHHSQVDKNGMQSTHEKASTRPNFEGDLSPSHLLHLKIYITDWQEIINSYAFPCNPRLSTVSGSFVVTVCAKCASGRQNGLKRDFGRPSSCMSVSAL